MIQRNKIFCKKGALSFFLALFLAFPTGTFAFSVGDTSKVKNVKGPRHYFMPTFFANYYGVPKRELKSSKMAAQILKDYSYSQVNTGFYIPLFTKDKYKGDSSVIANWHILLTGNFLTSKPVFSGLKTQHVFYKYSIGFRTMYNNGKKDVFFFDYSPFSLKDKADTEKPEYRSASTFVWSHIFDEKFSLRLGLTRTFILGDRLTLPYVGIRYGRLDKTYISVQFPRNILLNVPIIRPLSFNVIAKPVGGIFNFRDVDSIYPGTNKNLILGRRDMCYGLGLDYHPSKYFSLFVHAGVTGRNSGITMFSKTSNADNKFNQFKFFYYENLQRSTFVNLGLSARIGRSKSSYGNRNIYELQDMNSTIDPGDNNQGSNTSEIRPAGEIKTINKIKYKDLADLIDDSDLYD